MKKYQELVFIITGILLLLTTIIFVVYSINFLIKITGEIASDETIKIKEITRFNFDALEKLEITQ
ncbi:hypothetical protein JW698_00155 [Candidatus Wolfebacteria bacterium]|nr:hypothetical protein [Candidatus Wolfebacteria bacterium]